MTFPAHLRSLDCLIRGELDHEGGIVREGSPDMESLTADSATEATRAVLPEATTSSSSHPPEENVGQCENQDVGPSPIPLLDARERHVSAVSPTLYKRRHASPGTNSLLPRLGSVEAVDGAQTPAYYHRSPLISPDFPANPRFNNPSSRSHSPASVSYRRRTSPDAGVAGQARSPRLTSPATHNYPASPESDDGILTSRIQYSDTSSSRPLTLPGFLLTRSTSSPRLTPTSPDLGSINPLARSPQPRIPSSSEAKYQCRPGTERPQCSRKRHFESDGRDTSTGPYELPSTDDETSRGTKNLQKVEQQEVDNVPSKMHSSRNFYSTRDEVARRGAEQGYFTAQPFNRTINAPIAGRTNTIPVGQIRSKTPAYDRVKDPRPFRTLEKEATAMPFGPNTDRPSFRSQPGYMHCTFRDGVVKYHPGAAGSTMRSTINNIHSSNDAIEREKAPVVPKISHKEVLQRHEPQSQCSNSVNRQGPNFPKSAENPKGHDPELLRLAVEYISRCGGFKEALQHEATRR